MRRGVLGVVLLVASSALPAHAESVVIHGLRQWHAPDNTRLVFDLSAPVSHQIRHEQSHLILDLGRASWPRGPDAADGSSARVASLRVQESGGGLRIAITLKTDVRPKSFILPPAGPYGHRLVVDLHDVAGEETAAPPAAPANDTRLRPKRDKIIAIDAGHGGEDPGALGKRYRTREKDVTLAIARELAKLVEAEPGMKPLLVRTGDYYVGLRDRYQKARRHQADVFVSIHADAVPSGHARGSSVYALSERGASSAMAKFIADKENAADLIGGVSLNDKDNVLARVLLDLSHTKTIQDSLELGDDVLAEMQKVGPVHLKRVAQAGFAVLKSPDIPSVLVETAFITNPVEEKNLRTPEYQKRVAAGILAGVRRFLSRNREPVREAEVATAARPAPPGTREHVVQRGESLTSIARRYNVHVEVLRFFNDLVDTDIAVGRRLRIPPADADG